MDSSPVQHSRRVTRTDVARDAGVSTAVVSYVVNGGPRNVADATRRKVEAAIERLGYRPNPVARALKLGRTATLALLLPDVNNSYFAELAEAVEEAAFRRGFALILASSSNDAKRERVQYAALRDRHVDGLILASINDRAEFLDPAGLDVPTVLIDRASNRPGADSVGMDDRKGAFAATQHLLIDHGLRRIACLSGPEDAVFALEREAGWREALETTPGALGEVTRSGFTKDQAYRATLRLLGGAVHPEAILALSGVQAGGVLRACWELQLRVPEDIAVVAFDGTADSEFTTPPLTVVQHRLSATAETAVDLVLTSHSRAEAVHHVVPFELILRASCGAHDVARDGHTAQ
ncbi:LacI family DNA-binding transcriptional regulator [Humibacter ginsengisoli]